MTTWVENPTGGRDRGPRGVARAWGEVLVRPRRFFRNGVAPGDQAPGLSFAILVALGYVGGRLAFAPEAVLGTDLVPLLAGSPGATTLLLLLSVAIFLAPAALHLVSALQTVLLVPLVRDRAGISETVQVLAYATAPCLLAGLPFPALRAACAAYGAVLLVVGLREVHGTSLARAALAGALPAALVFGYAFGGGAALSAVLASLEA